METSTTQVIRTRYGAFTIDEVRDKKMAQALRHPDYFNEELLTIARSFTTKESVVVDIGAHIGTFAIPIAAEVEKVIAFEPFPGSFALLSRNAKENNVPIQLVNKALGSEKGSGSLVVRNASNAGANTLVPGGDISVTTLDEEVTHADFIKMDVEGMELEALRGAAELIERSRPVVLFEVNLSALRAHGASPRALERFFLKRGYRLYFPLERDGETMLARAGSATLLTALIAPRAWLCFSESAPFDLVAVPRERALPSPQVGFFSALWRVISNNVAIKIQRLVAFFK
ncbi:MAG: FkbM family methyltransferase [Candidatus Paceibacterota bacterium]|jgi:FkbM family methyltransferase